MIADEVAFLILLAFVAAFRWMFALFCFAITAFFHGHWPWEFDHSRYGSLVFLGLTLLLVLVEFGATRIPRFRRCRIGWATWLGSTLVGACSWFCLDALAYPLILSLPSGVAVASFVMIVRHAFLFPARRWETGRPLVQLLMRLGEDALVVVIGFGSVAMMCN